MFGVDDAALATAAASAASAAGQFFGQQSANSANRDINRENNAFNMARQHEAQAFNLASMRENLHWQENMSNSAYQRSVADMQKAGINPILAAQRGGASPGSGASASSPSASSSSSPTMQNRFAGASHSAVEAARSLFEMKNMQASYDNIKAQNDKIKADVAYTNAMKRNADENVHVISNSARKIKAEATTAESGTEKAQVHGTFWHALNKIADFSKHTAVSLSNKHGLTDKLRSFYNRLVN